MPDTLTQARLKELLHYNPETGVFINRRLGKVSGSVTTKHNGKQYRRMRIDNHQYAAHRLAWLYAYGEFPKHQIDHKNGCGIDNAIDNLRCATQSQNSKNRRMDARNKIGFNGVIWRESAQRYETQITVNKKQIYLGTFLNLEDAVAARSSANKKYGFHENHGQNRPL